MEDSPARIRLREEAAAASTAGQSAPERASPSPTAQQAAPQAAAAQGQAAPAGTGAANPAAPVQVQRPAAAQPAPQQTALQTAQQAAQPVARPAAQPAAQQAPRPAAPQAAAPAPAQRPAAPAGAPSQAAQQAPRPAAPANPAQKPAAPAAARPGPQLEPALPSSIGTIVTISGSRANILLDDATMEKDGAADMIPFIGTLLTVDTGDTFVLCLITSMTLPDSALERGASDPRLVDVELVGELTRDPDGRPLTFRRGVSISPRLGDRVQIATRQIMEKAYHFGDVGSVEIGVIHQDRSIPAVVKVDELLSKHFAVLGSTGSGKSCTVALLLRQVLEKHPNGRIVLLDPHNEYGSCFGNSVELVQLADMSLPYWFLTFEEIVETLIGDAEKFSDEVDVLRDLIPVAKQHFSKNRGSNGQRRSLKRGERYSVDVPTPYLISDIMHMLDTHMGKLGAQKDMGAFKRLKARIESITQDPRFDFMFGNLTVQDNLSDVMSRLFRVPVAGKPITVIQLMGLPAEIVNVLVSVLSRLAFDLAMSSEGRIPITFVCEEAHRYVPRDGNAGFEPTKRALSRIAKEGRKYGCSLGVVSQRPGDLDPTILSQCSTLLTMRLSNDRDQSIVKSAVSDASASLLNFLPSLGARESIIFGEGVTLPSRIRLSELPADALPAAGSTAKFSEAWAEDLADDTLLETIVNRWRVTQENENFTGAEQPAAPTAPAGPGVMSDMAATDVGQAENNLLRRKAGGFGSAPKPTLRKQPVG
ncbi:MAG TPA: DUF87 domain-containing protein [Afifellaceae bacterium]|nr:DUF87 domain-containing protein [Afifellaceae bacterium]